MEDMLDVVDEHDNVIGQAPFSKCHDEKLLHRISNIFVFKDDSFQELLLTKRSKKVLAPGRIGTPGGHVRTGETYLESAKIELEEEVFHEQELPKEISFEVLFKMKVDADYEHLTTVFRVVYSGPFSNFPEEVEKSFFMNINDLLKDIKKNPDKYSRSFNVKIKEYKKLFFISNI